MFYYIAGKLAHLTPTTAVVDAGGVGYKMTISQNTFETLPRATGDLLSVTKLYTYMSVREDGVELYGFASEAELSSFKMLLGVSGVGPKAAISILSLLTPEKFALAVCTDDKKTIAKASGIGPKTAARIILELQDKLLKQAPPEQTQATISTAMTSSGTSKGKLSEAQDALGVLGYSRSEALSALQGLDVSAMEIEDIIRAALKKLMK
ncbi:MAG: Holliday junction branch migration protein RuvA [Ruminococcaceae bacterium]|nr:Holliday junction branch migration protein RuvA [Oscillospiraceae bacterium]